MKIYPEKIWIDVDSRDKPFILHNEATMGMCAYIRADLALVAVVTVESFIFNHAGVIGEENARYVVKSIMSNAPHGIKIVSGEGV